MFKNPNPKIQPQILTLFGKIEQESQCYYFLVIKNYKSGCDTNDMTYLKVQVPKTGDAPLF